MTRVSIGGLVLLFVLLPLIAAAEEDNYVSGYEDAFKQLRHSVEPAYTGDTVEKAIAQFYTGGEEDDGTYPATSMWERDLDLRRNKPSKMSYSGRMFFKYSDDDISSTNKTEEEIELSLRYEEWDAFFRLSNENPYPDQKDGFGLEKRRIRYRGDDVKVTVGSFGQLFGRGLALNMFEQRTLDFDNEVEGAKVEAEVGEADLTVLWGEKHRKIDEDPMPSVTAARIEVPICDSITIGSHYVRSEFTRDHIDVKYDIYGGDVTLRSGPVRVFVEGVSLERDAIEGAEYEWDADGTDGDGIYVNASYSGSGYVLGAEYKDYEGLDHPFAVMPPIKRFPEFATANPENEEGYGFTLNWSPFDDGSMLDFAYIQDNHHERGALYTEYSAGYSSSPLKPTTWIGEYVNANKEGEKHDVQRLTLNHRLDDDWTATTFLENEEIAAPFIDSYTDNIYEAELAYRSLANFIYTHETTSAEFTDEEQWGLWEFKWKPDETQEINLIYGSRREGLVCSGGVCRLEPGFDGFKAD